LSVDKDCPNNQNSMRHEDNGNKLKAASMTSQRDFKPEFANTCIKESDNTKSCDKLASMPSSLYAGLPLDESCGSWMDETIIPMEDSDSEVESSITSIAEVFPSMMSLIPIDGCDATLKADGMESSSSNVPEYSSTNIKESDGTKLTEKLVSLPTSSYAGLPIDDSCGLWMDETVIPMEDSDEEVDSSVLSIDKAGINGIQNIISTEANDAKLKAASVTSIRDNNPEHSNTNIKESDNSKPCNEVVSLPTSSYAGLPLDESCGLWMDDTYMRIEDSDEEAEKYIASHDENCPTTENIIPSEVTDGKHEAVGMVFRSDSVSEYSSTDIKEII